MSGGFNEGQFTKYAKAHINEQFSTGILLYKKSTKSREQDTLLEAKGIVQTLLSALGISPLMKGGEGGSNITYEPTSLSYFHPKKQGLILYNGIKV
ncbi:MAG: hypothetical protein LBI53_07945 [Candidatus Peribacteria bacterium]|nr:hypothetical protein [Candidatus Peribacteria bacterium]